MTAYPPIDEVIEILDVNGADQIGVCDPQIRSRAVVVAHDFAVLFHQVPVVLRQVLQCTNAIFIIMLCISFFIMKSKLAAFQVPQRLPMKGSGFGPAIPCLEK